MDSEQDHVYINCEAHEEWTKREQLCLASVVSCSTDQKWMTVGRSLTALCGANQPPDKFSQNKCAAEYMKLLENVETPKRKPGATSGTSSSVVETTNNSILHQLTKERIQELKSEMREQQETYAKLYTEVVNLEAGNLSEEQIQAMWVEIQREEGQLKARMPIRTPEIQGQVQEQEQHSPTPQIQQQQDMETCKPQV